MPFFCRIKFVEIELLLLFVSVQHCPKPPSVVNGNVKATGNWKYDTYANYSCDPRHAMVGPNVLKCLGKGETVWWNEEPSTTCAGKSYLCQSLTIHCAVKSSVYLQDAGKIAVYCRNV